LDFPGSGRRPAFFIGKCCLLCGGKGQALKNANIWSAAGKCPELFDDDMRLNILQDIADHSWK
jgi:hypothetical protein